MDLTSTVAVFAVGSLVVLFLPRIIANGFEENRPRPSPRRQFVFWLSLLVLLLGLVFDHSGLIVLLFVVFWCLVWIRRLAPRWTFIWPAACLVGVAVLYGQGYKLYGSPRVVDNRPLPQKAFELGNFEYPNIIVGADGSRHHLRGVTFPEDQRSNPYGIAGALSYLKDWQTRFAADAAYPSGYVAETRIDYWCGNTFFPRILPAPLPKYRKQDFGKLLSQTVQMFSAEPTSLH